MKQRLALLLVRLLAFARLVLTTTIVRPAKWAGRLLGRMLSPVLGAIFWLIRKLIRWILLIGILSGALYLATRYGVPSYEKPRPATLAEANLPPLSALKPIEGGLDIRPQAGVVRVALEVQRGSSDEAVTADLLAIYRWGRGYYTELKCGPDYPANMCRVGLVTVLLVGREQVVTTTGTAERYVKVLAMGLDQIQLDKLLAAPPANFEAMLEWHAAVAEATLGTGGFIRAYNPPEPFEGFRP